MAIAASDVMSLRRKTGLGMMECKQALTETGGDIDKAVDLLRQKGLAKMDSRSDRVSAEGRVAVAVSPDASKAAIIEINTETDFTAENDSFQSLLQTVAREALGQAPGPVQVSDPIRVAIDEVRLTTKENIQFGRGCALGGVENTHVGSYIHFTGKIGVLVELGVPEGVQLPTTLISDLCMHIAAASPTPIGVTDQDVDPQIIEKEKQIAKAQAIEQGKPEAIAEKMVTGKVRRFYEDHVLLKQAFIKDEKQRVGDLLPQGVTVRSFVRYQVGVA